MTTANCPRSEELIALAMGDAAAAQLGEHVRQCAACRQTVERIQAAQRQSVEKSSETGSGDVPTIDAPLPPTRVASWPERIGRYLIVSELGKGGQGQVFRAVHPTLQRDVAIKWSVNPLTAGAEDRLASEGQLLAQLEHPGVVRVFDLDTHQGRPFLVMELVRGVDLNQYASQHRFTPLEAARLVIEIAQAVHAAHLKGITHQDIKPHNILIDEAGRPRLTDFGIARLRDIWHGEQSQPTGGTLAYMAPEQLVGEAADIGPRADVFALAGMLFFLLTGQPPRRLSNDMQIAFRQVLAGLIDDTALASAAAPAGLRAICRRALSADPKQRPESAAEFARLLEACCGRRKRLVRTAFLVGGAALIVAAIAVAIAVWPPTPKVDPVKPAPVAPIAQASLPTLIDPDVSALVFDELVRTDLKGDIEKEKTATGVIYRFDGETTLRFDRAGRRATFARLLDSAALEVANDWNETATSSRAYRTPQGMVLEVPLLLAGGVPRAALKDRYEQFEVDTRVFRYHMRDTLSVDDIDAIVEKDLFKSLPTRTKDSSGAYIYNLSTSDDRIAYYASKKVLLMYAVLDGLDVDLERLNAWNELRLYSRVYRNRNDALVLEVPLLITGLPPRLARKTIIEAYRDFTAERIAVRERLAKTAKQ
jgi:hypothetical protein